MRALFVLPTVTSWKEVQEGRFREDLYHRFLYVIPSALAVSTVGASVGEDVIEIMYSLLGYMGSLEEGALLCVLLRSAGSLLINTERL